MKKNEGWGILGLLLLLGLAAGPAAAQEDRGIYLGASLGEAKFRSICGTRYTGGTCDPADTGYRLFGGYRYNANMAVELGYGSVGEILVSNSVQVASGVPVSFEGTLKALDVSILPILPLSESFAVFGRLGIYRSQLEAIGPGIAESEHKTGFTWGAGLRFGRAIAVRAEYQRYHSVDGGASIGEADIDFLNLGLEMRF